MASDFERGWSRATVVGDYAYDNRDLLGTSRTGPDLMNIGARQPSEDWQLGHLYAPRAYVPGSIMPAFPFLFERKTKADKEDHVVKLASNAAPAGQVVVARPQALDLARYLLSLNRSYPIVAAPPAPAASGAKP